jgi:hypothetical protein
VLLDRPSTILVAEISRPRATIIDGLRPTDDAKKAGRERTKPLRVSQRVNWYHPTMWAFITEVANLPRHRFTLSPTDILRDLRARWKLFNKLSTQVLGTFFTGEYGSRKFTPHALSRAATNNVYKPAPSTRRGILVSQLPSLVLCITDPKCRWILIGTLSNYRYRDQVHA